MLRVGVVGLGVGEQHLIGYLKNERCEVVLACDQSPQKLAEIGKKYHNFKTTDVSTRLLDASDIDLVSIASYDDDHFEQVIRALSNGKHVFVEKPLCRTREELQQIKQCWDSHDGNLKLKSNLVLRAAPAYRWIKAAIMSGTLGRIYAFDGDYLYGRLPKIMDGWRSQVEDYSVMEGGGIHLIDLMLWLTGERPITVRTVGNKICSQDTPFRYDDFAAATMTFESGLIGRITANFGCVHGHQHVVRIFGTDGTFIYDDRGVRWQPHRDPAPPPVELDYEALPTSKYVLIGDFVDAVLSDEPVDTQLDFDVMSVCIASDKSQRQKQELEIDYV